MRPRIWTYKQIPAADILNGMETIKPGTTRIVVTPTMGWIRPDVYLSWAKKGFDQKDEMGRDAAVCYAKRAVCCQIDSYITNNYLNRLTNLNYPEKIDLLNKVGISIPDIVWELVIDPRNDIEHSYRIGSESQAKRAVQLADLLLKANQEQYQRGAIIYFGNNPGYQHMMSSAPGNEFESFELSEPSTDDPFVFIDALDARMRVMILHPKEDEIDFAELSSFSRTEAVTLASRLRMSYSSPNFSQHGLNDCTYKQMRDQLGVV